jgi:hypothetical protein
VRLIFKNERLIKNRQAIATLQAKPFDVSEASFDSDVEYAREIGRRKSAAVATVSSTEQKKGEFSDQRTESILPEEPINRNNTNPLILKSVVVSELEFSDCLMAYRGRPYIFQCENAKKIE